MKTAKKQAIRENTANPKEEDKATAIQLQAMWESRLLVRKIIKRLRELKAHVDDDVWAEIVKHIKVIRVKGYTLIYGNEGYDEQIYVQNILGIAERAVAGKREYAAYSDMEPDELLRAWCEDPKLRLKFDCNFLWFVNKVDGTFPLCPSRPWGAMEYLRGIPAEQIERMIHDTEISTQKPEARDTDEQKPEDLITSTVAISEFNLTKRTLRRAVDDGRLKDYREDNHSTNSPVIVSRSEVSKYFTEK